VHPLDTARRVRQGVRRNPRSATPTRLGSQTEWGAPPPDQVIAHTNLYWTYQTAPGRTAGTVKTGDVHFGGAT
jgi:hypothetical protein